MEPGKRGQFEVFLGDEVVAGREKGFLTRLLGGGWPDPEDVVATLGKRLAAAGQ